MAVGAGSIKRASKLNAEAAEPKKAKADVEPVKDEAVMEKVESEKAEGAQKASGKKRSAKKTTAKTEGAAKKASAKKAPAKKSTEEKAVETERSSANTVLAEENLVLKKGKNETCHLTENLPIHLL